MYVELMEVLCFIDMSSLFFEVWLQKHQRCNKMPGFFRIL